MSITIMQSELLCLKCNKDTVHEITYVGNRISNIECMECKEDIQIEKDAIIIHYLEDIAHRVKTKPERIRQEIKKDWSKSIISFPIRAFKKIISVGKDFKELIKYLKTRYPHNKNRKPF